MTTKVYWSPNSLKHKEMQIAFLEPENLYAYLCKNRKSSNYLKCYSTIDTLKNAFIIKAPLHLKLKLDRKNNWLSVDGVNQAIYDSFIENRHSQSDIEDPGLVTCLPSYIFYADTPIKMSILPLPFLGEVGNTRVIPGSFDISRWVRPIDWAFEIVDPEKEIVVNREDCLFGVFFTTPDNSTVQLERVFYDEKLVSVISSCVDLKLSIKNTPLQKCYEMADSFISMWRKHRGK